MASIKSAIFAAIFDYDTAKIVHIKNKRLGIFNRVIQLIIIGYIIGYAIIYSKGYQEYDYLQSVVVSKVKGTVLTEDPNDQNSTRIWDVADYVIPPQENGAFFVTTNILVSPNQTMGKCGEDWNLKEAICTNNESICLQYTGHQIPRGNGIATGECVEIQPEARAPFPGKVCEIHGWCPTEIDNSKFRVFLDTRNFTVMIKNNIEFPKFKVKRRNIIDENISNDCLYDKDKDPFCPIFKLETIAILADEDYLSASKKGALFTITIKWDCNLDLNIDKCKPMYVFDRLDSQDDKFSPGWNFRYADHYVTNGVPTRTLNKAYGLRFVIMVEGRAGKFNIVNLVLNIGSGIALLAIATVLTDILVLYVVSNRNKYYNEKYLEVTDEGYQEFETRNKTFEANTESYEASNKENKPRNIKNYGGIE